MMQKPFGTDLYIRDGEWVVPYGLLLVAMLFGDAVWVKSVMFVMYLVLCVHIVFEHKQVMGKKDFTQKQVMTVLAFLASTLISFLMPIYAAICYATYASHLKKTKRERQLADKIKTYTRMFVITGLALFVHVLFVFSLYDDIMAGQTPKTIQMPGTTQVQQPTMPAPATPPQAVPQQPAQRISPQPAAQPAPVVPPAPAQAAPLPAPVSPPPAQQQAQ